MAQNWSVICPWVLQQVQALPYKPGLRWCFYRALEQFSLTKKDWSGFKAAVALRRKKWSGGWEPDTLSDTVRYPLYKAMGPTSWDTFKESMISAAPSEGLWTSGLLDTYVEVWYEAEAMTGQFEQYVRTPYRIPLRPFRGDFTIAPKWETAQHLKAYVEAGREVTVLYFGDADTKGAQIPFSALKDIREWSGVDFEFVVGGLTTAQAKQLRLQQNFERPGQYQWEALSDLQAKHLIQATLEAHVDMFKLTKAIEEADRRHASWLETAKDALDGTEGE